MMPRPAMDRALRICWGSPSSSNCHTQARWLLRAGAGGGASAKARGAVARRAAPAVTVAAVERKVLRLMRRGACAGKEVSGACSEVNERTAWQSLPTKGAARKALHVSYAIKGRL